MTTVRVALCSAGDQKEEEGGLHSERSVQGPGEEHSGSTVTQVQGSAEAQGPPMPGSERLHLRRQCLFECYWVSYFSFYVICS